MSISNLIGIPYFLGGSSEQGADCWGLVRLVFSRERGIELPPYNLACAGRRVPPRGFVAGEVERERARAWRMLRLAEERPQPLDVVLLRNLRPADHVAVVSEDPRLILTTDCGLGSHLCEWGPSSPWGLKIEGVFRHVAA